MRVTISLLLVLFTGSVLSDPLTSGADVPPPGMLAYSGPTMLDTWQSVTNEKNNNNNGNGMTTMMMNNMVVGNAMNNMMFTPGMAAMAPYFHGYFGAAMGGAPTWAGSPLFSPAFAYAPHGMPMSVAGQFEAMRKRGMNGNINSADTDDLATMQTGLATGMASSTSASPSGNRYNPEPAGDSTEKNVKNPYAVNKPIPGVHLDNGKFEPVVQAAPIDLAKNVGNDLTLPNYQRWVGFSNPGQIAPVNMAVRGAAGNSKEPASTSMSSAGAGYDKFNPLSRSDYYSGIAGAMTGLYNPNGKPGAGPTSDPHPSSFTASPNEQAFFHTPSQMYDPLAGPNERVPLVGKYQNAAYYAHVSPSGPGFVGKDAPPVDGKAEVPSQAAKKH